MSTNTLGLFMDMAPRNVKVAVDLLPSAISGFLMQEGKREFSNIHSNHAIHYNWKYDKFGNEEFINLYKKAKKGQWDSDDLQWDTQVDPDNMDLQIFPEKLQPMFHEDFYQKLDKKTK
ncbi:MAG: hypothetical protein KDK36_12920, partial [Leptospiraceae bacterium]|nr:hypothetical protein [Leptospiraceae bacterium]